MLSTPLHPLLVHFPIALFTIGVIAQIIAIWRPTYFNRLAFLLILIGEVTGILAYLTGDGAEEFAKKQWGNVHQMVEIHQEFATITLIVFGMYIALKLCSVFIKVPFLKTMLIILSIVGVIMITLTGHYGGKMVYQIPNHTSGEAVDK